METPVNCNCTLSKCRNIASTLQKKPKTVKQWQLLTKRMAHRVTSTKESDVSLNASDLSSRCPALTEILGLFNETCLNVKSLWIPPQFVQSQSCVLSSESSHWAFSSPSPLSRLCGAHHLPCEDQRDLAAKWHSYPPVVALWQAPSVLLLLISLHTKTRQWSFPHHHPSSTHSTTSPTLHFRVIFFPHLGPCFVSAPSLRGPRGGKL